MPDFLLLGPFEVRDGERVVELRRKKHRALLALLALRAGEAVPADVVIEELWGSRPPKTAREALHNYVSQLRKQLGEGAIETRGSGYLLEGDLDLARFERLVADGRAAATPEERAEQLRAALELWRGPPLADLAYEPFAAPEIQRLEELRLAARKDLIDAELELGRQAELVPELELLVAEHPYRERLRGQLMLALYRSGRQADALAAYQDARTALVEELGLEPSTALRELEQAILRQDPALDLPAVLPPVEERRKTVTVLFCELAAEGRDPEELRDWALRARAAIEAHGGSVEARGGNELLGVFGVPAAHEDDALRALRAASELGEGLRAGVDTGEVLAGHGFVSGEVVSTATSLQRAAGPGEVRLGEATLALCRDALEVEGANGAYRLLGIVEDESGIGRALDRPLVGRGRELAALEAAFVEARESRRCRVVTIAGEPGIGKTRLARELVARLGDEARVLVGRCVSYGQGATWLPLAEMLEQAGERLEPILASAGSPGEVFLGARRVFEQLAEEKPLLLALDDVHWAEPTLLDLVEYLGERAEGPILVLCLTRDPSEGAVVLGPLPPSQAALLAADAEPELRARVVETAGGNPLFVEQLVAFAKEGGSLDAVPPSVEALIAARLDLLEPEELATLQRAAVAGRLFSRSDVQGLGGDVARLTALQEKGLVRRRREGLRFHHVLVRDVAYASLPKAERAELHERLADRLEERGEPDELVGYQLEQAYRIREKHARVDGRARRLANDAGRKLGSTGIEAWKRGEVPATVNLLGRAAALLPERDPFRIELLCELGPALRTGGELRRAEKVLEEAVAEAPDRRLELRARLELAGVQLLSRKGQTADGLLGIAAEAIPAFEAVGDDRSLGRAWRWLAHVHGAIRCRYAAAAEAGEHALAHHERSGWSPSPCLPMLVAALHYGPTPVNDAIRRCRRLLSRADVSGRPSALVFMGGLEAMRGRFSEARRFVQEARSSYEELGQIVVAESNCGSLAGEIELLAGDGPAAEQAFRTSCAALERARSHAYLATRTAQLAEVLCLLNRDEEAEQLTRVAEELGAPDDLPTQFLWRRVRAKLLARVGKLGDAETLAREAVLLSESTDSLSQRGDVCLALADVLGRGEQLEEASEAAERAIELFQLKGNLAAAKRAREVLAELAPV